MTDKRLLIVSANNRPYIWQQIQALAIGDYIRIGPPDRLLAQSAKFHAMCGDVARQAKYGERVLKLAQWKVLFISSHAIETGLGADVVEGLAGEYVNLRESSAEMSIARMASLIEYVACWGAQNEIKFKERHF